MVTPPASARSHSPFSRLCAARWIATSDVEQAVCTATLGPPQVQTVGDARRQEVFVVAGVPHQEGPDLVHQLAVGRQVVGEVGLHPGAGEHADRTGERVGNVPGVFERLPAHLEEVPVLGIEDRGLAGAESEEPGVEELHVGQRGAHPDVVRVAQQLGVLAGVEQILVRVPHHRLDAGAQVAPVLPDGPGAGEPSGHADDGDGRRCAGRGRFHRSQA